MAAVKALSFVVLLAVFEFGSCTRCYQCTSQSDQACGDPFTSTRYLMDCATQDSVSFNSNYLRNVLPPGLADSVVGAPRYCHKIVMQTGTVIRTCLDGHPADLNQTCQLLDNLAKRSPGDITKAIRHCSVCDRDGCNGAGSLAASLPLAALTILASFYFYKQ